MRHLTTETLARIADGPATEDERAHLEACPDCRAELEALRRQAAALAALPAPPIPAGLRERVLSAAAGGAIARPGRAGGRWTLRAAAAIALFLGGAAVGAAIDGPDLVAVREPVPTADPVTDAGPDSGTRLASGPAPAEETPPAAVPARGESRPTPTPVRSVARPTPPADPADALREAEARYVEALARYADRAPAPSGGDPTSRLAALEGILYTTRAALDQSPDDPVLEGFYQSALAQRAAILDDVTILTAEAVY